MKRRLKIVLIILIVIFGTFKLTEWYLEYKFEALLNADPSRNYNISYKVFDLHTLFTGITLDEVIIIPINKPSETTIHGTVEYAELSGFNWAKFLFSKEIDVEVLKFIKPNFDINKIQDSSEGKKSENIQDLFGDILSRLKLVEFQLQDGSIQLREKDSIVKGEIHRINITATEILTDSIQLSHIIPFKLGNLEIKIDSIFFNINSYTKVNLSEFEYSIADEAFSLKDFSLEYDKDWIAVSEERGIQDDVIEFELKELKVSKINISDKFWTDLEIKAHKMEIDGLSLRMRRNKKLKRPVDEEKPLFNDMVNQISNSIDLDSIVITNSNIQYGELSANMQHTGVIEINDINGSITQFSTFPERKKDFGYFEGSFSAQLNQAADMQINLKVPYENDSFTFHTRLRSMPMIALNKSLIPLLGVEFDKGYLYEMDYRMQASYTQSKNHLKMNYDNFHLRILEEEDDGTEHKKNFISSIANVAIRHHNLPEDHGYITASYTTPRNIYRSPFQYIVAGVLDGAKHIVPRKGIQSLINKDEKQEKKRRRKNRKRRK